MIPELTQCFPNEEVTDIVIAFSDSIIATRGSIAIHKILLQAQLTNSPLIKSANSRAILVPNICRWLKPHLGAFDELMASSSKDSQATKDANRISWLEGTRLATSVIAGLLDKLHRCLIDPAIKRDRHAFAQEQDTLEFILSLLPRLLESYRETESFATSQALQRYQSPATKVSKIPSTFPSSYPVSLLAMSPPSSAPQATQSSSVQPVRGEIAALVIVMIHITSHSVLMNYFESILELEGYRNFSRFLSLLLRTGRSFLRGEVYPVTWLNISMLAHKAILRILGPASSILIRQFVPDRRMASTFNSVLWQDFFDTLLSLLSSPALSIEDFSPARQRAVWQLAGDLRGEASKIWLRSWEALSWSDAHYQNSVTSYGGYQVKLTNLVESVLELCLSHHDELRSTAVTVLYSMIISEFR